MMGMRRMKHLSNVKPINLFSVIFKNCQDVVNGKMSREDFTYFLGTLYVKHYIEIETLSAITYIINFQNITYDTNDDSPFRYAMDIEIRSTIEYVAYKLDIALNETHMEAKYYDLFELSGLTDFVIDDNPRQYIKYCEMVKRSVDISALGFINDLSDSLGANVKTLEKLSNNKKFQEMLDAVEASQKSV
jgi:hypothetical protein